MTGTPIADISVEADMKRIFAKMQRRRAAPIAAFPLASPAATTEQPPRHGGALRFAAPVVVLLAIAMIVAFIVKGTPPWDAARPAVAPEVVQTRPAPAPSKAPTVPAPDPVTVIRVEKPPATTMPDRRTSPVSVPAPRAAATRAPQRPSERRQDDAGDLDMAPAPFDRAAAAACWKNPAQCPEKAVVEADQRLARAYQRARQAGVPVRRMRTIRAEWDDARELADDPPSLIAAYGRLADELDDARAQAGERDQ